MIKRFANSNVYKYMLLVMVLALVIGVVGCKSGDVVAKVGDEVITKDDLYDLLVEQNGDQVLNSLISEKIIDLEVKKQKIKISKEDIEKEIDKMKEQYGGEEAFNMAMAQYGLDPEALRENVSLNLKIKKLLEPEITVTEKEMTEYFAENKKTLGEEEQVSARHILVETEEEAKKVQEKLNSGEDFAKLAKEYSIDEGSKEAGGELGFFAKGEMVKEFEETSFKLKAKEISEPIKTEHGFHIIEVLEKKEAREADYDEVKGDIKETLLQQKISAEYGNWYQKKLEEYKVENFISDK